MNKLLIATNNKGKIEELQALLSDLNVELVTSSQIGLDLDVIEDGTTYAENATKKAVAFAQASGLISLADDTGLEVDALDGAPGLYSKRYGSNDSLPPSRQGGMGGAGEGQHLSDPERRRYLVQNLQNFPRPWRARFRATIAIAIPKNVTSSEARSLKHNQSKTLQSPQSGSITSSQRPSGRVTLAEGTCEGEIIPEDRGTNGFGYDPIFLFPELGKTMAELSMDEKNRLSHRARAVMNAKGILGKLFG